MCSYRLPVCSLITSLDITMSAHTLSHYGSSADKRAASEQRDHKLMELFSWFIGRHIILPKADTSLANYWLTLLQESGVQTPSFNYSSSVVSELLG